MQSASTCFSTENALNPELEFASRKRFASLIRQTHTPTHTYIVAYLRHTRTQTLEIAKNLFACISANVARRHGSGQNFCLKLIFERQKMCLFVVV